MQQVKQSGTQSSRLPSPTDVVPKKDPTPLKNANPTSEGDFGVEAQILLQPGVIYTALRRERGDEGRIDTPQI